MSTLVDFNDRHMSTRPLSPVDLETRIEDLSGLLEAVDSDGHPFARGGYSSVFKYRARCQPSSILIKDKMYAVKVLKHYAHDQGENLEKSIKRLKREIDTWSSLHHPNVLQLHGVMYKAGNPVPCLVSDFMKNGTADEYVKSAPRTSLIHLLRGMAKGLSYIHSRNIIHGDIKGNNVLVTNTGDALMGDFGLSRTLKLDGTMSSMTSDGNRASRWTAVEYLDFENGPQSPTKPGDVWSYGCTALQLLSGELPYYDIKEEPRVVLCISKGELPKFPHSLQRSEFEIYKGGIAGLCHVCWVKDPWHRPNIDVILSIIDSYCLIGGSCERDISYTEDNNHSHSAAARGGQNAIHDATQDTRTGSGSLAGQPQLTRPSRRSSSLSTITPSGQTADPIESDIKLGENEVTPSGAVVTDNFNDSNSALSSILGQNSADSPTERTGEPGESVFSADLKPWLALSPPPSPSVKSILRCLSKSAQGALNEYFHGNRLQYRYTVVLGPSNTSTHTVICSIDGREYGIGSIAGKKKDAKELAALHTLVILDQERAYHIPTLRYLPIFKKYISSHTGFRWSAPTVPVKNDNGEWTYKMTFTLNGVVLGAGVGTTQEDAQEKAARNAATMWIDSCAETS